MISMNFSTRPFYNERGVYCVLGVLGILGVFIMVITVTRTAVLFEENMNIATEVAGLERELTTTIVEKSKREQSVSVDQIAELEVAMTEANRLVGQRTFSWTAFFNVIDTTLPPDVMLTVVRPRFHEEGRLLELEVVGRNVSVVDEFIVRLEGSGYFSDVLARQEELASDGMYRVQIQARVITGSSENETGDGL